jgi:hypothetical protein
LTRLAADYAYWYDFYETNRVRVNISSHNLKVSQVLAMDALNGVSVAYQYTSSIIMLAATYLYAGEDIVFVFSSVFEQLWRQIGAPVQNFVKVGYVDDGAVRYIAHHAPPEDIRRQLQDNGAQFILCYFDENSADHWSFFTSNEIATREYEFLFNWLLSDPTLGLVFKPKRADTLFHRISRISGLIDAAKQTGRCHFFSSDNYPAKAALAADVCVGKLANAAAEARLAGVPSVMVDVVSFRSHPTHQWGRGRVWFDDWDSARAALEKYRADPKSFPEFGDWSPGLDDFDPFRDGQASIRIATYVQLVHQALKQGASKQEALAAAAEQYKLWESSFFAQAKTPASSRA